MSEKAEDFEILIFNKDILIIHMLIVLFIFARVSLICITKKILCLFSWAHSFLIFHIYLSWSLADESALACLKQSIQYLNFFFLYKIIRVDNIFQVHLICYFLYFIIIS